ncbi:MAG: DUF1273 domain-containing protein [Oscillospiraceae bacterium]|nr:DUF1273 domain-containing protein [Oscillospiraceae bacterium]
MILDNNIAPGFPDGKTVCFSGHRPEKLPDEGSDRSQVIRTLKSILYKEIIDSAENGCTTFITGLARGVDLWAGEMIMELKAKGMPLKLVAAAPYKAHGNSFKGRDKFILGNILLKADEVVYVSENYTRECMRLRNEYMVNRSDKLIAVVSDYRSGTGQTIRYAERCRIEVKIINAAKLENDLSGSGETEQLAF